MASGLTKYPIFQIKIHINHTFILQCQFGLHSTLVGKLHYHSVHSLGTSVSVIRDVANYNKLQLRVPGAIPTFHVNKLTK
jgi:hypothetical protein